MPSEPLTNLLGLLAAGRVDPEGPVEQARAGYELLGSMMVAADDVAVTDTELAGRPALTATPSEGAHGTVLYLHGGGFTIGSPTSHRALVTHLAAASGARVVALDYRLAPEHPYPAALDDAVTATTELLTAAATDGGLAIAGDSAGGGLALSTLVRLRDDGRPGPVAAALISPWCDLTLAGASIRGNAELDVILAEDLLTAWAAGYAADTPLDDPLLSPLGADLAGIPPLLIHVGTDEILLDDARRLARRATADGVAVELHVAEGMPHHWHLFAGTVPESDEAVARVGRWLRHRL